MASDFEPRIRRLAAEARKRRENRSWTDEHDPGGDRRTPEDCATAAARDGLGSVVALYVEARTAEKGVRFSTEEMELLHRATNDWLSVYAACYGVDVDPDFTVREAAELLVDTHDIRETAALLTKVPGRDRSGNGL
ncbi:Uncharacterized protein AArcCO_1728 [Halalkaliarchaeum sp. AArc-CO]|uniref:hypothetical protein n=1 Tax=unclassified Halalkaliarchaeum TaxID=2678344 RepID=UPI00217EC8BE|nr:MULTISPECIES: hypothetical protein [unclassified Halalkaliarchaeum]MDR5674737.1 hypothetical protein [Halalkaliarchaeum sp. AArc-GB]UWG51028.1 Uncharacterized protein AArcCO_1728 [Halalkaliarchaeum sp. AArc-CO]